MSVIQTVTYVSTNTAVTYADTDEALNSVINLINASGDPVHMETITNAATLGNMFASLSFDSANQTLIIERTWLNSAWDEYRTAYPLDPNPNKDLVVDNGWTITEDLETL